MIIVDHNKTDIVRCIQSRHGIRQLCFYRTLVVEDLMHIGFLLGDDKGHIVRKVNERWELECLFWLDVKVILAISFAFEYFVLGEFIFRVIINQFPARMVPVLITGYWLLATFLGSAFNIPRENL